MSLSERALQRLEDHLAARLDDCEPSLPGVLDAFAHALAYSYASGSRFIAGLLPGQAVGLSERAARTAAEVRRLLHEAATPYLGQIRRTDPPAALDAVARTVLGACVHAVLRPDGLDDADAWKWYADQLGDMTLAYLRTPDRH
ncbi:hypothetical protein FM076_32260 [Streptomyces albus subsp. chlorinus]|uniref:hypothetical protein n=1 Tax=Streptomyces albus TaxID=1888 RepID=UPI0015713EAD|nr:hypothetical protein [Streptomyces albus]NSC25575.1 hypothetical protein [Streptomyces albus subsp. chlorinus]